MIHYLGIETDASGWKHFAWIATLNGVNIEYKTGLGHCKNPYKLDGARCINNSFFSKPKSLTGYLLESVSKDDAQDMLSTFNMRRNLWNIERFNYVYVRKPKVRELLYSLVIDYTAAQDTFEDFCNNMGYDTDSRRALETYLSCQESGHKLRKIVKSENYLERIAAWEL